jgi:uncharacterized membrane protein
MVEIIVLRVIHVLGGIFWVGSALFNAIFLFPALGEAGPAAGAIMGAIQRRRLFIVMPIVALLTILSGLRLMWIVSGGFASAWFGTGRGMTFSVSGGAAIVALLLGITVSRPLGQKLGAVRQAMAKTEDAQERARLGAEANALQVRTNRLGFFLTVLLLIAAIGMAVGRYIQ